MKDVVIVAGARTAITTFGGPFRDVPVVRLASLAIKEVLNRANLEPALVEHVAMGYVLQSSEAPNAGRMAGLYAGIPPESFTATTLNVQCGSSLEAVNQCTRLIQLGEVDVAVAAGVEIMSRGPFQLFNHRWGHRMGHDQLIDYFDHLSTTVSTDLYGMLNMADTAENLAKQYEISRQDQDEFAVGSNLKAAAAMEAGRFTAEIFPVEIPQRKGKPLVVTRDERPRSDSTLERLAKLPPAFRAEGTVTGANASGINDGAAAALVMSADKASNLGLEPMAVVRSHARAGVHPAIMGIAPAPSSRKAAQLAGMSLADIDLFEVNEAFSAQALAVMRELELDPARLNVNGGAVALGHPVGMSGVRILITLIYEMMRHKSRYGLASLCCGGGLGVATIVENCRR